MDVGKRRKVRRRRSVAIVAGLLGLVALALAVVLAAPVGASPGEGQLCSRCHTQTATATVRLAVSATSAKPGAKVKLSGTVPASHTWNKVKIQKRLGAAAWQTWKNVSLSGSSYSPTWTAPTVKGKYSFRTIYLGDNVFRKSTSPVRSVTVK